MFPLTSDIVGFVKGRGYISELRLIEVIYPFTPEDPLLLKERSEVQAPQNGLGPYGPNETIIINIPTA